MVLSASCEGSAARHAGVVERNRSNQARSFLNSWDRVKDPFSGHCLRESSILLRNRRTGGHTWETYSNFPRRVHRSLRVAVGLRDHV